MEPVTAAAAPPAMDPATAATPADAPALKKRPVNRLVAVPSEKTVAARATTAVII
jgi:hypothetical protein